MAKQLSDIGALCEALGVDRPNEVTRVVLDIRAGHFPVLLVERIGDATKILAALREPGIELYRQERDGEATASVECPAGYITRVGEALCVQPSGHDGPHRTDDFSGAIEWEAGE